MTGFIRTSDSDNVLLRSKHDAEVARRARKQLLRVKQSTRETLQLCGYLEGALPHESSLTWYECVKAGAGGGFPQASVIATVAQPEMSMAASMINHPHRVRAARSEVVHARERHTMSEGSGARRAVSLHRMKPGRGNRSLARPPTTAAAGCESLAERFESATGGCLIGRSGVP
eukprot:scaffold142013_cov31-Tisochrysis_lutea.AAC.7